MIQSQPFKQELQALCNDLRNHKKNSERISQTINNMRRFDNSFQELTLLNSLGHFISNQTDERANSNLFYAFFPLVHQIKKEELRQLSLITTLAYNMEALLLYWSLHLGNVNNDVAKWQANFVTYLQETLHQLSSLINLDGSVCHLNCISFLSTSPIFANIFTFCTLEFHEKIKIPDFWISSMSNILSVSNDPESDHFRWLTVNWDYLVEMKYNLLGIKNLSEGIFQLRQSADSVKTELYLRTFKDYLCDLSVIGALFRFIIIDPILEKEENSQDRYQSEISRLCFEVLRILSNQKIENSEQEAAANEKESFGPFRDGKFSIDLKYHVNEAIKLLSRKSSIPTERPFLHFIEMVQLARKYKRLTNDTGKYSLKNILSKYSEGRPLYDIVLKNL